MPSTSPTLSKFEFFIPDTAFIIFKNLIEVDEAFAEVVHHLQQPNSAGDEW